MNDPAEPAEPLQRLPAPLPRCISEYKPVDPTDPDPLPTNVGGYDELLENFRALGHELPRTADGLPAIDDRIDSAAGDGLGGLSRQIGMFYEDLLTHSIPGAHWEVTGESPCVQVTKTDAIDVIGVAQRRLEIGYPSLVENHAHVLGIVAHDA